MPPAVPELAAMPVPLWYRPRRGARAAGAPAATSALEATACRRTVVLHARRRSGAAGAGAAGGSRLATRRRVVWLC